ncbi:MAG: T9SS type A sorting domain-containing protein, partial [Clostridia bacterium]|nr:T9SS type A sorting domain-containing protein [Clostridia bacterium]
PDETIADIGYYYYDQLTSTAECRADEIKLYPNPSAGIIHFSGFPFHNHEIFNILILNNSGETLQQLKNVDLRYPIDLSCLPNGFYHCHLNSKSHYYLQKIIIIK